MTPWAWLILTKLGNLKVMTKLKYVCKIIQLFTFQLYRSECGNNGKGQS